ncbi:unnamed protein product [Rhizophagus irregularis]|nr:unnamed protein product [Rhizophagus irregularis]
MLADNVSEFIPENRLKESPKNQVGYSKRLPVSSSGVYNQMSKAIASIHYHQPPLHCLPLNQLEHNLRPLRNTNR